MGDVQSTIVIELRARINLYRLLANFFELTGTENSIAQYVMISYNKITVDVA